METIVANVKAVKVFDNDVEITIDKEVDNFVQERDENGKALGFETMKVQKVNVIRMNRSVLTAQLCELSDDIALYRSVVDRSLEQRDFAVILFKAQLKFNHQLRKANEEVNGYTFVHDKYSDDLLEVKLGERAMAQIDNACSLS